jgi:hypothetical protein
MGVLPDSSGDSGRTHLPSDKGTSKRYGNDHEGIRRSRKASSGWMRFWYWMFNIILFLFVVWFLVSGALFRLWKHTADIMIGAGC